MKPLTWHEDHPKFIVEDGEPREAQVGDEATHVLMPISVLNVHESFYRVAIAERNLYRHRLADAAETARVQAAAEVLADLA